jgi:TatD DNase family protein
MLVDTHCHLDFERFAADRDQVVERALAAGVERIIVPAIDLHNCPTVLHLAGTYPSVYAAVGVHPNSTSGWQDEWLTDIRKHARHKKVVAIGEIGLDYYWDKSSQQEQHQALRTQLALAAELDLPVILHNRESSTDLIRLISSSPVNGRSRPGVLHSFSASWETAKAALDLGFYIGFTGPITFKKADDLRIVAARVPLDRILIETDAPFLAPQPRRGKRNEPAFVRFTAERLAALRKIDYDEFTQQTTVNAVTLFGLQIGENR